MRYLRFLITSLLFTGLCSTAFAQQDTTEYLFKKARYSYTQYHIGYSPMFLSNGQTGQGFTGELFGIVLNDKIAIGLDIDGFSQTPPVTISSYPHISLLVFMGLNIEPLIKPRKVVNFSFPVKIGYGGAQIYERTQNYVTVSNPDFLVVCPGAMAWVNLFKPISVGVGGNYRMAFNGDADTFDTYSGFAACATLRFKFYTREFQEKMAQRQREYYQQHPPNN